MRGRPARGWLQGFGVVIAMWAWGSVLAADPATPAKPKVSLHELLQRQYVGEEPRRAQLPDWGIRIVELPREAGSGAPLRPRHGLAFRSEATESALRSFGLDAQECFAPVVRFPSRLRQDGNGLRLEAAATVALSCKF